MVELVMTKIKSKGIIFTVARCSRCGQSLHNSYLPSEMPPASLFLWWDMVLPIFAETFQLYLHFSFFSERCRLGIIVLVLFSYCTNSLFPSGTSWGSRLLSFFLSSSSKPLLVTCYSSSSIIWTFVLEPWNFISLGVIASSPYNNLNGIKFVDLDTVVLCAQTTFSNSSTHFPLGSPTRHFEIPVHMIPFALSTAPFDCGCLTEAKHSWIPMFWQ